MELREALSSKFETENGFLEAIPNFLHVFVTRKRPRRSNSFESERRTVTPQRIPLDPASNIGNAEMFRDKTLLGFCRHPFLFGF